jgi:putative addiction module killer protein
MKTILTTNTFNGWFADLRDRQAKARILARIDRAESGNFGDHKLLSDGVYEMRIHYATGYRVYFMQRGIEIVVLLAGGDKTTQQQDINKAIELAKEVSNGA